MAIKTLLELIEKLRSIRVWGSDMGLDAGSFRVTATNEVGEVFHITGTEYLYADRTVNVLLKKEANGNKDSVESST